MMIAATSPKGVQSRVSRLLNPAKATYNPPFFGGGGAGYSELVGGIIFRGRKKKNLKENIFKKKHLWSHHNRVYETNTLERKHGNPIF